MSTDSTKGAGGLLATWAVWPDDKHTQTAPSNALHPGGIQERHAEHISHEIDVLKTKYELLERENELLRQRLAIADRQVEIKDSQIIDFKVMSENLSRQNQVLLMLAQGVPIDRILKPNLQDINVNTPKARPSGHSSTNEKQGMSTSENVKNVVYDKIIQKIQSGMTYAQAAEALNKESFPTLSGTGKWNRKRIGHALNNARKTSPL